jgi:hypothetical protein
MCSRSASASVTAAAGVPWCASSKRPIFCMMAPVTGHGLVPVGKGSALENAISAGRGQRPASLSLTISAFHFTPPRHPLKRSSFRKPLTPHALPGIVSGVPSRGLCHETFV